MEIAVVWYRNDLRVHDHEPLTRAAESGLPVIGLYCFDPRQYGKTSFGFNKTGSHRARFIKESVEQLKDNLEKIGVSLIVQMKTPEEALEQLHEQYTIRELHYYEEVASEEKAVEQAVVNVCGDVHVHTYYGRNMVHPDDLPFHPLETNNTFTHFRKKVEKQLFVRPLLPTPSSIRSIDITSEIPSDEQLGIIAGEQVIYRGGSAEGRKRLEHYFFDTKKVQVYKETRNGMSDIDDSSKLSPYLAHGCLSPRYVYWRLKEFEATYVENESTYWLFVELLWRDYFSLMHMKFGNHLFKQGGMFELERPWSTDQELVQAWVDGQTGYPLVDACMRELKATGFMSNRGRQCVASFFTKNAGLDWRIGAEWFESCLIDYDVSSNYGNWCYVAGVGTDARLFRSFNVTKQGKDYDPTGAFAKKWLPELAAVPGEKVYDVPTMSILEEAEYGVMLGQQYPYPVFNLLEALRAQRAIYERALKKE